MVELSIVLVILGLLTGGILTGQTLIRAAELRSVTTEYNRYVAATSAFRDKYFAVPGDMRNATAFWGAAGTCPGDHTTPSTDSTTCDGDGDGQVISGGGGPEGARFWQHLANAGFIEGTYTGVTAVQTAPATNFAAVGGENVPLARINAEWLAASLGTIDNSSPAYFEGNYGNALILAQHVSFITVDAGAHTFLPEEAWNIDTKIDDGEPATGKVRTLEAGGVNCNNIANSTSAATADSASYNLTQTTPRCNLVFTDSF